MRFRLTVFALLCAMLCAATGASAAAPSKRAPRPHKGVTHAAHRAPAPDFRVKRAPRPHKGKPAGKREGATAHAKRAPRPKGKGAAGPRSGRSAT